MTNQFRHSADFSPGAERALAQAERLRGLGPITARVLAAALFHDRDGEAFAAAHFCGLDIDTWSDHVKNVLSSSEETRAFRRARSLAREYFGDRTVTSSLLLLALQQTESDLADEWAAFGMDGPKLERKVLGEALDPIPVVNSAPPAPPDPCTELSQDISVYRVLDANADRASEAIRVLEDYVRFVRNDGVLAEAAKSFRHDLGITLRQLPLAKRLAARDTPGDVGTTLSTANEYVRDSVQDVVAANSRRLQESLRTLEEFGKIVSRDFAIQCEQLRYRAYTLEAVLAANMCDRLDRSRLCYLVGPIPDLEWRVREAIAGGVDMVQLRAKSLADRELIAIGRALRQVTRSGNAVLIVNDRPDIARVVEADGVHLGQDDMSVSSSRAILGADAIIGVSTHNIPQVRQAVMDRANYIGMGPTFPSLTKEFPRLAGLEYITEATRMTSIPAFAIGGIDEKNVGSVRTAGGTRIAVSGCIGQARDPAKVAAQLRKMLE
ncbi:MAG: thiamine phosphate synthase [Gemmataceae bacterium]|nr:thiamine phosphate synthase [Gemmataceae bacterium]